MVGLARGQRSEEHTSELQSLTNLVCRLLLEKTDNRHRSYRASLGSAFQDFRALFNMLEVYTTAFFFFFNDTATTEIYTLSLHDALPICLSASHTPMICWPLANPTRTAGPSLIRQRETKCTWWDWPEAKDRKSTRLNSSH